LYGADGNHAPPVLHGYDGRRSEVVRSGSRGRSGRPRKPPGLCRRRHHRASLPIRSGARVAGNLQRI